MGGFFEEMNIDYRYEPEGFWNEVEYLDGDTMKKQTFYYLPDFYLPESKTWVEVKGNAQELMEDNEKMTWMLDFVSPLPHFHESFGTKAGLLLLGDIPNPHGGYIVHPLIQHHEGLIRTYAHFTNAFLGNIEVLSNNYTAGTGFSECFWDTQIFFAGGIIYGDDIKKAYLKARQARFEHGEEG